jgi:hypothetical protein
MSGKFVLALCAIVIILTIVFMKWGMVMVTLPLWAFIGLILVLSIVGIAIIIWLYGVYGTH